MHSSVLLASSLLYFDTLHPVRLRCRRLLNDPIWKYFVELVMALLVSQRARERATRAEGNQRRSSLP
jgi:hypothetical protein